jgi:hypothetical protein
MAENEAVFRELNEQLAGLARAGAAIAAVCECGDLACVETIPMTRDEYRRVREQATTFAVVPGHADAEVEDVVASAERYHVVRKKPGLPATIARETS